MKKRFCPVTLAGCATASPLVEKFVYEQLAGLKDRERDDRPGDSEQRKVMESSKGQGWFLAYPLP